MEKLGASLAKNLHVGPTAGGKDFWSATYVCEQDFGFLNPSEL